ncbi:MAG: PAS domain S-box protein [Candidatus Aminicenantaceae bacterium]
MDANKIFADKYGKDLMELHKLMVELEQIDIVRQRSGKPHWKTEKEYRDFFARQTEAVAIVQNGIIVRINPQISEMIGCSPEEVVGTPFVQFIHPSELPRVQKNYENRIEGKEAPIIYKTIAQHKDGRNIYVILKAGMITYWEKTAVFLIAEMDPDQKDK